MGEVTLQSQNGGLISYRLTFLSLHVNRPSHSWDTAFSKFDLENQGSRSKDHDVAQLQVQTIHRTSNGMNPSSGFRDMGSARYGPSAAWFDKFLAHGLAHMGQITITVHNYRSRQVHETLNKSIQPFQRSAFRKVWTQFVANLTSFWPMGKPIWGTWANDHDSAQLEA